MALLTKGKMQRGWGVGEEGVNGKASSVFALFLSFLFGAGSIPFQSPSECLENAWRNYMADAVHQSDRV